VGRRINNENDQKNPEREPLGKRGINAFEMKIGKAFARSGQGNSSQDYSNSNPTGRGIK